jgi:hypothetical protein
MKFSSRVLMVAAIAVACVGSAKADVVVVGVDGLFSAGGFTQDVDISGTNLRAGGNATSVPQRWDAAEPLGITNGVFEGTFGGTLSGAPTNNNDWHVNIGDTFENGTAGRSLNASIAGPLAFKFIEIFYSLDSDVTLSDSGTGHRFSFNGTASQSISLANQALIPTTAGSHRFVIDIDQLILPDSATSPPPTEIDFIRWDPWNVTDPANIGTAFTIDRITFGTELVASVPEPSSLALIAIGGVGMLLRRRR